MVAGKGARRAGVQNVSVRGGDAITRHRARRRLGGQGGLGASECGEVALPSATGRGVQPRVTTLPFRPLGLAGRSSARLSQLTS